MERWFGKGRIYCCSFLKSVDLLYYYHQHQKFSEMASLRVAFVQTCQSGNPCFYLLSSISCLISSLLGLEDKSTQQAETSLTHKDNKRSAKFEKANSILKQSKQRSTWIESFSKTSLLHISNDGLDEMEIGSERRDCVHAL